MSCLSYSADTSLLYEIIEKLKGLKLAERCFVEPYACIDSINIFGAQNRHHLIHWTCADLTLAGWLLELHQSEKFRRVSFGVLL